MPPLRDPATPAPCRWRAAKQLPRPFRPAKLGARAKKDFQQCLTSARLFGATMAEGNSERTGLLSQGTRGTLERSRDGFYARPVF